MLIVFLVSICASIVGAICGIIGRSLNKRMDDKAVENLFIALMAVIIGISIYNCVRYAAG